jgi:septal ring factor EnvC (AmiA/AmiB activator)
VIARRVLVLGCVLGAIAGGVAASRAADSPPIEEQRRQLQELKRLAEEKRAKARQYAREEKGVLKRLGRAEEALSATRDYIRKLEVGLGVAEQEIQRTVRELTWAQDELTSRREELARRLRYAYMAGKARSLEVVFSASTFPNLLQRTAFLNRVLDQDRRLVEQVKAHEAEVQEKLGKLQAQRDELSALQAEKLSEEKHYESLKSARQRDLSSVRDQRAEHEAAARELEESARRLQSVLAELERRRREAVARQNPVVTELDRTDFGKNRGRLVWPVVGEIITRFGRHEHPKYKTVTVSNGIDVKAVAGSPVRSVAAGVVDLVQWLPGYGQTVSVTHGRAYYTVYGHLGSVSVRPEDAVEPGALLGTVGDTGSLKGDCLHFEVRSGGAAQDPLQWLR